MVFRTDSHRNPTAFTTDVAKEAGLVLGVDYEVGDGFQAGALTLYTARLIGDPIAVTLKLLNAVGFYTKAGYPRWSYIAIPYQGWISWPVEFQKAIIGGMYHREGGVNMLGLFPSFIRF